MSIFLKPQNENGAYLYLFYHASHIGSARSRSKEIPSNVNMREITAGNAVK